MLPASPLNPFPIAPWQSTEHLPLLTPRKSHWRRGGWGYSCWVCPPHPPTPRVFLGCTKPAGGAGVRGMHLSPRRARCLGVRICGDPREGLLLGGGGGERNEIEEKLQIFSKIYLSGRSLSRTPVCGLTWCLLFISVDSVAKKNRLSPRE